MTEKKICDCCEKNHGDINCHHCELNHICEECWGGYDENMKTVCWGCLPPQPHESDPEWKKQQIKNGLRQLGNAGLLRLKAWIEAGKDLHLGGGIIQDGKPDPFIAALPLTTIETADGDAETLMKAVELCFHPFDWEPPNYLWELKDQTPDSLLEIINELLSNAI